LRTCPERMELMRLPRTLPMLRGEGLFENPDVLFASQTAINVV
jgi:hypothetical protein